VIYSKRDYCIYSSRKNNCS